MTWWQLERRAEEWREEAREHIGDSRSYRVAAALLLVGAVAIAALGIYWSREPAQFAVQDGAPAQPVGTTTATTLIRVVETLLDKPGGLLANDITPPGTWLDNQPNWEYGALTQARDLLRVLREATSRSSLDAAGAPQLLPEDDSLARAAPRLNFSHTSWLLPSSESQYREAVDYLREYRTRLHATDGERAVFDANAANLAAWLDRVAVRLDQLSQRLSACVQPQENPLALPMSAAAVSVQTPAGKIDDVFFEARGSAWALLHFLRAAEIDYAQTLAEHGALPLLNEAIRDLEQTQARIYSPLVLNGSGFGLLANHSLVMASYTARAYAAVTNLRKALAPQPLPSQNSTIKDSNT